MRSIPPCNRRAMPTTSYAIALGSNRRHGSHGGPPQVLAAAVRELERRGIEVEHVSRIRCSSARGPAGRSFANGALLATTDLSPPQLLKVLKETERSFGRRPGRRWGPRVLDLD